MNTHDRRQFVARYASQLSALVGRSAEALKADGLFAGDFRDTLRFEFQDRSYAVFRYALVVHDAAERQFAVMTEHCGYFLFPDYIRVIREPGKRDIVFDGLSDDSLDETE